MAENVDFFDFWSDFTFQILPRLQILNKNILLLPRQILIHYEDIQNFLEVCRSFLVWDPIRTPFFCIWAILLNLKGVYIDYNQKR